MWIWAGAVLLPTLPTLPHSPFLVHIWSFLGIRAYFFWLTSLISHPSKATKSICPRIGEEESLWLLSQLLLQPFVLITANPSMSPIVSFHLCNNCESFFTVLCCIHVDVGLSLCICFIQQSAVLGWIGYLCLGDKAGLRYSHARAWTHSAYLPHPPLPPFRLWTSLLILICTGTLLVSLSKPVRRHMFQCCWIEHPAMKSHLRLRFGPWIWLCCEARQKKATARCVMQHLSYSLSPIGDINLLSSLTAVITAASTRFCLLYTAEAP